MDEISIVVPVYNVELYLERCIESILAQTFINFKLILVNDGSPDKCPEICDSYRMKDHRVEVIHRKNGGLSAARNSGIDWVFNNNPTEWITFIDSDDWVHPQYLELLLTAAKSSETDVAVGAFSIVNTFSDVFNKITLNKIQLLKAEDFFINDKLHPISACGRLFKSCFFRKIKFPEGRIHEDRFTTYKILFQCNNIVYVEDEVYFCFENNDSITRVAWTPKRLDDIIALEQQIKYLKKSDYRKAYDFIINEYALLLLYSVKKINQSKKYYFKGISFKIKFIKLILLHKNRINFTKQKKKEAFKYVFPIIYRVQRRLFE